jgi:hypothetical protein
MAVLGQAVVLPGTLGRISRVKLSKLAHGDYIEPITRRLIYKNCSKFNIDRDLTVSVINVNSSFDLQTRVLFYRMLTTPQDA